MSTDQINQLPQIEKLLQESTVFVLGAGASKPYGFPLWHELKKDFNFLASPTIENKFGREAIDYWQDELSKERSRSVDEIAFAGTDNARRLFQFTVANRLLKNEVSEYSRTPVIVDWIEVLASRLIEWLQKLPIKERIELCRNLHFVNLNYDRLFFHRFERAFASKVFVELREWELRKLRSEYGIVVPPVAHPHGIVAFCESQSGSCPMLEVEAETFLGGPAVVKYGLPTDIRQLINHDFSFLAVNAFEDGLGSGDGAYQLANTYMDHATNIIVIGVSTEGWRSSKLRKNISAKGWSTGCDNLQENIVQTRMFAKDFIETLCRIR
jgi:hypothetical protein